MAYVGLPRMLLGARTAARELAALPSTVAFVAAQSAWHMTASMSQKFAGPQIPDHPLSRDPADGRARGGG